MRAQDWFKTITVLTTAAFVITVTACGGGEYDSRCDQIKQKVRQCFPGNEVSPEAMCSEDLVNLAGPIMGAECGYLNSGKADDKWLWALGGLVVGGALVYGIGGGFGGNNNGNIPWECRAERCGQNAQKCWDQGIRCPGPNGHNPNYNPGFGNGNMPFQCQAPQCQNEPVQVKQQCASQGFPCPGWNNNNNNWNQGGVPFECQQPQCNNQPWNIKQQCMNMGHPCGNNNNGVNVPWQCQQPQCNTQPLNVKQQCAQMGHFCGGANNVPWECQQPQCYNQPWNIKNQCQQQGFYCN
jgi:hypothetical protein